MVFSTDIIKIAIEFLRLYTTHQDRQLTPKIICTVISSKRQSVAYAHRILERMLKISRMKQIPRLEKENSTLKAHFLRF